nr:hypothetical protein GZ36D8_49 [uncultured archaeon GZfos36D8]
MSSYEGFYVRIYDLFMPLVSDRFYLLYRLFRTLSRSVSKARIPKLRFKYRLDDVLQSLLHYSISDCWNAQRSLFTVWLWYIHPFHGFWHIPVLPQQSLNLIEILLQISLKLFDRHIVYSACSSVLLHLFPRFVEILPVPDLVNQGMPLPLFLSLFSHQPPTSCFNAQITS